ncbi:MAG: YeeE/YedE family protein [Niveispirillum sp.]|nr:YeeE/YedE thiosulfate transporter family protein [Niveispirillum sp.]MBP7337995.1 YeeE/YedE family protein [Niveispirillum sp.]
MLAALFLALVRFIPTAKAEPSPWTLTRVADAVLRHRWPAWVGGVSVSLLGTATYLRTDPLGVTAQIGWLARLLGEYLGFLDAGRLPGLDGFAGCATKPEEGLLTLNGWFVLSLIAGSLSAALAAGQWRPTRPRLRPSLTAWAGGVLMGWGRYPRMGGTADFRSAVKEWLCRRFYLPETALAADRHIVPVAGTREALHQIAHTVIDRERQGPKPRVLMPNPFYQIYEGAALIAGGGAILHSRPLGERPSPGSGIPARGGAGPNGTGLYLLPVQSTGRGGDAGAAAILHPAGPAPWLRAGHG